MKIQETDEIAIVTECLLNQITELLDDQGTKISGEPRVKLGIAESNLYKILQLLKQ